MLVGVELSCMQLTALRPGHQPCICTTNMHMHMSHHTVCALCTMCVTSYIDAPPRNDQKHFFQVTAVSPANLFGRLLPMALLALSLLQLPVGRQLLCQLHHQCSTDKFCDTQAENFWLGLNGSQHHRGSCFPCRAQILYPKTMRNLLHKQQALACRCLRPCTLTHVR